MSLKSLLASLALAAASCATAANATTYATQVWAQYGQYNTGAIAASQLDPENARSDPNTFFRMGLDGLALFAFGSKIKGESLVFETTYGCRDSNDDGMCDSYKEKIDVYALDAGFDPSTLQTEQKSTPAGMRTSYKLLGLINNPNAHKVATGLGNADAQTGATISLASASAALDEPLLYILIHDRSWYIDRRNSREGFDIQQVAAVTSMPVPAGFALLLGGLGVMGLVRRWSA